MKKTRNIFLLLTVIGLLGVGYYFFTQVVEKEAQRGEITIISPADGSIVSQAAGIVEVDVRFSPVKANRKETSLIVRLNDIDITPNMEVVGEYAKGWAAARPGRNTLYAELSYEEKTLAQAKSRFSIRFGGGKLTAQPVRSSTQTGKEERPEVVAEAEEAGIEQEEGKREEVALGIAKKEKEEVFAYAPEGLVRVLMRSLKHELPGKEVVVGEKEVGERKVRVKEEVKEEEEGEKEGKCVIGIEPRTITCSGCTQISMGVYVYLPEEGPNLGGYDMRVFYNPEVIKLTGASGGEAAEFGKPVINTGLPYLSQDLAVAPFNGINNGRTGYTTPAGTINVARITFKVVGKGRSRLSLQAVGMVDTGIKPIPVKGNRDGWVKVK